MAINVPSQYQQDVTNAAKATGLPADVVAAQIDYESSFNPNAVSSAGAEGIAQFEPGTWSSYGTGSPFDPTAAFAAYAKYMEELLKEEGGSVRKALAAYNAGPGNLGAGYGYADHILGVAGQGTNITAGSGSSTSSSSSSSSDSSGGLLSFPSEIVGFFSKGTTDLSTVLAVFKAFFQPSTYIRMGAGVFGIFVLVIALIFIYKETRNS